MTAILKQDAPELPPSVPSAVRGIVEHCLEKEPGNRFQSAKDLGFALAQGISFSGSVPAVKGSRQWPRGAVLVLLGMGLMFALDRWLTPAPAVIRWSGVRLGGPEISMNPHLSPDGHLLAFEAMVDGATQVAVMKPESGNWNVLTRDPHGLINYLSWSPDGGAIYFSRSFDVPQGVFTIPFLGGGEHLVLENAENPAILPDGTLLVSRINQQRRLQLFRFWPETGKLQDLPVEIGGVITYPTHQISRDGRRAIVHGTILGKSGSPALIDVDLANALARPLPTNGLDYAGLRAFTLSPDGRSVIAAVGAKTLVRIVRIPLDGHCATGSLHRDQQRPLPGFGRRRQRPAQPVGSPDGVGELCARRGAVG